MNPRTSPSPTTGSPQDPRDRSARDQSLRAASAGTAFASAAGVKSNSFQYRGHAPDDIETIDPSSLQALLASGKKTFILDVRDDEEIARSGRHLPSAREIPVRRLFAERDELLRHAGETVVTVSTTGIRSRAAAFTLHLLGFADVRSLEGGLAALPT